MCVMEGFVANAAGINPLDPFGANAKNQRQQDREQRGITWAREDEVRGDTFAHQEKLANIEFGGGNTNRSALNTSSRTGTAKSGGGKTNRAY